MPEKVTIGAAELWLGDCREILPTLSGVDAVVTDPPYGIGYKKGRGGGRGKSLHGGAVHRPEWPSIMGDDQPFDPAPLLVFPAQLIWGADHFVRRLPETGRLLAWNKLEYLESYDSFADIEFAWLSIPGASRVFNYLWKGVCRRQAEEDDRKRSHPTQKPVALMEWCLRFLPAAKVILDPYMGSGTTGVACARAGKTFIGVEADPGYFETACRRIEAAQRQGDLISSRKPAA